ncbi:Ankyrin-1 [Drechslerella dactyloides]|uniref:Ankyrin-1 n=1 Tax=Drechslerella dactyloides TaxID=74499 RepID=A0AAD6J582_DREDA|nr:Ankyrin-1 [Drechslerella dactyloides]
MADPLSITASIIAVVQLSNAVLSYCYRFRSQAKDADKDITSVINEVEDLWAILNQLQEVVQRELPPCSEPGVGSVNASDESAKRPAATAAAPCVNSAAGNQPGRTPNALLAQCQKSIKSTEVILKSITDRLTPLLKGGLFTKLKWPFESKVIQEKLDTLQKQKTTFQLYLSLQQMKSLDLQSQELTEHKDILFGLRDHTDIARRTAVLNWYKTSDPEQNHKVSRSRHDPNTCQWIFDLDNFRDWSSVPGNYLWIHGIPGAGKTIICSTIIEHLKAKVCGNDPMVRVIYYYFDFADAKKQTLDNFLQSAIYQLLSATTGNLPETGTALYDKHSGLQEPSSDELLDAFVDLLSEFPKTYVVLDAIDECSKKEREKLFKVFPSRFVTTGASLLVTSRREPDIERALRSSFHHTICIEDSKVDADVRTHVTKAMESDPAFQNWNAAIKKEVSDAIAKGSRGMFRWAVCQLDTMKKCLTPGMIRAELRRMPETLDQTYDRILEDIPSLHQNFVQSALRWLAFSNRPLLLTELAEAAVIDLSMDSFDPAESRFLDPEKILELCGSLITFSAKIYDEKIYNTDDWLYRKIYREHSQGNAAWDRLGEKFTTIALSHYSVKEYLSSDRLQKSSLATYFTSVNSADAILAECSLLYLLNIGNGDLLLTRGFKEYPLLEYCAVNWMDHCRKGISEAEKRGSPLNKRILRLFDESRPEPYINWLNSYDPDVDVPGIKDEYVRWFSNFIHRSLDQLAKPLYYAVRLGSSHIVTSLLEQGANVEVSGNGYFGSSLAAAAFYGHLQIVEHLLQVVPDPNGKGGEFGNVLQAAAAGGSCDVVKLLVKYGADVDAVGGTYNTALVAAATYGHHNIISFLLKSDANLSVSSVYHGTPLYQAALAGDAKTVNQLLQAGANVNELSKEGTALYAAALSGSLPLVQTLLRKGADVNKGGRGDWGYPLTAAASQGHINVVRALIRAKANVNAQQQTELGGRGISALEAAIESRDLPTFRVILDAGGDPNVQGWLYPNGLYAALWTGELEMARILLERNAEIVDGTFIEAVGHWDVDPWFLRTILDRNPNIDAHLGDRGSALHVAIMRADEEAVRLILDRNPYLDAVSEYGSPLACAISKGMLDIAKELIRRGADVSKDYTETPFQAAISLVCDSPTPNFEMADLLLEKGADVNCAGGAAIKQAIYSGDILVLQYLASHGADLNMLLAPDGWTPLQVAASQGKLDVAAALLDLGADPNGQHGEKGPTIYYALQSKNEAVVRLFLKKGTRVDDSHKRHSLLVCAIFGGMTKLVSELIRAGANVNKVDIEGWTPLAVAIDVGDEKMERLLRSHGAKASMMGAEVFLSVIAGGDMRRIRRLLDEGVDPNQDDGTFTAMIHAARSGRKRLVDLLHEYGCSVDPVPDVYGNPLGIAAESGDISMTEHLLSLGADPNASNTKNSWALASAARRCNIKIVDMLLDAGADVTLFDGFVFQAAIWGGEKMLNHLLPHLPPADRGTILGRTLQYAAHQANLDMCKFLIDSGADINFTGGDFGTPLQATVCYRYHDDPSTRNSRLAVFDLLLSKGAEIRDTADHPCIIVAALTARRAAFVQCLLDAGANPNGRGNSEYDSPLQAAACRAPELLEPLIAAGADVNATGGRFGTALHVSAWAHDCRSIAILLQHGAKIDAMSPKYGGVIQAAAKRDSVSTGTWLAGEESVRAMQLLHSRGASVTATGGRYGNALQLAAKSDNIEGVKWLLARGAGPAVEGRWGTALDAAIKKKKWRVVSYLEQRYGRR